VTRNGQRITEVPKGYDQRGIHNVEDEIRYASNSDFVFHDSCGFEAGGADEVKAVWRFIRTRSSASPSQQLHAIWLCIPTDNDRPLNILKSGFFSEPTASVPVIGVFTKLDGRLAKARTAVLGPNPSRSHYLHPPPEIEQKVDEFIDGLEKEFRNQPYAPFAFIRVGKMHEESEESVASCNGLLQTTMGALPNGTQRLLLGLTIWKRNRWSHTVYVLEQVLKAAAAAVGNIISGPGEDEESVLRADEGFKILMVSDTLDSSI